MNASFAFTALITRESGKFLFSLSGQSLAITSETATGAITSESGKAVESLASQALVIT